MEQYIVKLGGVYDTEDVPGTAADPTTIPTDSSDILDPVYLMVGINGQLNELRCISNLHIDDFDSQITSGQWIQVTKGYGSSSGSGPNTIFDGVVVNKHMVIGGDVETTELVAFDHGSYLLQRICLHGQMRRTHTKEQAFYNAGPSGSVIVLNDGDSQTIDTDLCFNPDGQPNMTVDTFVTLGNSSKMVQPTFHLFEVPFRDQMNSSSMALKADYWTLKDAILYLLNTTNTNWCIDPETFTPAVLTTAFGSGNPRVDNIHVEGNTLAQALDKLLSPHNYGYWVDPSLNSNNLHNINFFQRGAGRYMHLMLSARGTKANLGQSNLVHGDFLRDNASTINRLQAFGDRITFTTLAETNPPSGSGSLPNEPKLVHGWHDSDLVFPPADGSGGQPNWFDPTFLKNYGNPQLITPPLGSSSSNAIFGIGRMWLVNLGESPYYPLEDLSLDLCGSNSGSNSGSFGSGSHTVTIDTILTGANSIDPRRFEKPELYVQNAQGGLLTQEQVVVELSTDSGNTWEIVDRSEYRILPDSLGIVFVSPDLTFLGTALPNLDGSGSQSGSGSGFGKGYWQALFDGTLELRVLASIKSDEKVHARIDNDGSAFPLAIDGVFHNPGYKRVVYNAAINDAVYYVNYPPSQLGQDDTDALSTLAQAQLSNTNKTIISGAARVLFNNFGEYQPGDSIGSVTNRIYFSDYPTIVHIVYKFQEQQVELSLDNHRVATLAKAKAMNSAANERQHKLGVENPRTMQGGHGGPYLPETNSQGDNPSMDKYLDAGGGF